MAKKKSLQAKLAALIDEYGLDAVVQSMMMAEQLGKPKQPKKIKPTAQAELIKAEAS